MKYIKNLKKYNKKYTYISKNLKNYIKRNQLKNEFKL